MEQGERWWPRPKVLLASVGICALAEGIGALTIGDLEKKLDWFMALNQPPFALPLEGWYVAGALYNVVMITVLYRVWTRSPEHPARRRALWLVAGVIIGNQLAQPILFIWKNLLINALYILPFCAVATALWATLRRLDLPSSRVFLVYLLWLLYDIPFFIGLWLLN
jgi:tryptophan-rich sensory protein